MSESPRASVVVRLETDLLGPMAPDEIIESKPADVYVTGILWPKNTVVAPEEDERLDASSPGEDDGAETADQAQAQSVGMRRPSTAGVSFAVAGDAPEVQVTASFATYREVENGWQRVQHKIGPIAVAVKDGISEIDLSSVDVKRLRLHVRSTPFPRGLLTTITLVNDAAPSEQRRVAIEKVTLFQVGMEITPSKGTRLISRPSRRSPVDDDDWSAALLYRDAREFAAGHTCSADWTVDPEDETVALSVRTAWIPQAIVPAVTPDGHAVFKGLAGDGVDPLSAAWLSNAATPDLHRALIRLCDAYEEWIGIQTDDAKKLTHKKHIETADRHLKTAGEVLGRMRAGADFLKDDAHAADSFRLACLVMETQRQWGQGSTLRWRPFQLGFLLLTLQSAAKSDHPDRSVMDLLWFPTGGGKTEAYLGLIAFVAMYRRLDSAKPDDGAGVAVIMRYTLRLLTTQQFIRAAAMICACEAVRRGSIASPCTGRLGSLPFSIGLWVGESATPNRRQAAFDSKRDDTKSSPKQLTSCPACKGPLTYTQNRPIDPVHVTCTRSGCVIGSDPLPVWTVDEDIYAFRPTLVIGTVDKFAQIVRREDTARLFAVRSGMQPQLILQDELHLISGPLGTLAGLYETALDLILSANGTKPKIIGSTATIRRAADQVLALFNRGTCQFPPPGLDAADSGFTVIDKSLPGRLYAGVTTAGRSAKFTLQATSASLLQSGPALPAEVRDYYWTLVAYFNSLRELGGALVLMQDDVYDTIGLMAAARGGEAERVPRMVEELTSRRSQSDIRDMLTQLERPAGDEAAVDVLLATNMISVGVDISRLGLMLVNGQPKTMAEYIQATSRVGRGVVPGLVIPVLNNGKPRDRSHYETFRTWHATLYREVEATSVTPFAARARDRALHAVLVAIVRHIIPGMLTQPVLDDDAIDAAEMLIDEVAARAAIVDPKEADVAGELKERLKRWIRRAPKEYWNRFAKDGSLLQGAEEAASKRALGRTIGQAWPTPNTLRGVEPSTNFRLAEGLRGKSDAR